MADMIIKLIVMCASCLMLAVVVWGLVRDWKERRKKKKDSMTIDIGLPVIQQYEEEAKEAFSKYNVRISSEDEKAAKTTEKVLLEAISVIFENDRQNEGKTLKTIGKFQDTVYIRKQTDNEKLDAEHSNRMFTEYSVFMDDKRIKGCLEKALQINRNADRNNVSKKVLDEISAKLREAFMIAHRDYKEPVKQLELFTITD